MNSLTLMQISPAAMDFIKETNQIFNNPAIYFMEYDKKTCCGVSQRIEPTIMEEDIGNSRKSLLKKTLDKFHYPIFIEKTHESLWNLGKMDVMGTRAAKRLILLYPE